MTAAKPKPKGKGKGKGVADIDSARLALLHSGTAQTRTLTECLALDFALLWRHAFPELNDQAAHRLQEDATVGITRRMDLAARLILEQLGPDALPRLQHHASDTVRGWACYLIGAIEPATLSERLRWIEPLANDAHFGVREWAWLALRPHLARELDQAIHQLGRWTASPSEYLRRFACEAIRPRGVWSAHIAALKNQPELALPILEALCADPSAYVQDSVGNWLNDATKSQPQWVGELCARWQKPPPGRHGQNLQARLAFPASQTVSRVCHAP